MTLAARTVAADGPEAQRLTAAFLAEIAERYGGERTPPPAEPAEFAPPAGRFLVLDVDGEPVAGGAVRRLDDETAEVRRVYVAPAARGAGAGRALLEALEGAARAAGYRRVRLDTGSRQPEALGLFRASGYRSIPDYNGNAAAAHWFEKEL